MAGVIGQPKPLHEFTKSLKNGIIAEEIVTRFLESEGWTVLPVKQTMGQNKHSGDLSAFREDMCNNSGVGIEVKCDAAAHRTGNFFVETAVEYDNHKGVTPGWAEYCLATYIFFYMPYDNSILVTTPTRIRNKLPVWNSRYKSDAKAENKSGDNTWRGIGTLVPIREMRRISKEIRLDHDYRRC